MNKLITLFFCALTFLSYGQTNLLDIGVEGGLGVASLRGRGNDFITKSDHIRISYEKGLFIQYNFKKIISIKTGAYYAKKGSSTRIPIFFDLPGPAIDTIKGEESFDYITVPLLVKVTFGNKIRYFINAGPYMGFLLKQTEQYGPIRQSPQTTLDGTDSYKKTEKGISTGAGVLFNYKQRLDFSMEIRNNLGLTNTSKLPVGNDREIKTNATNILLGISYKLGHRNNLKRK